MTQKALPVGTVTFLFTDIAGSTQLLQRLRDQYAEVLAEHQVVLRAAIEKRHGYEADTQANAFLFTLARASDTLTAVEEKEADDERLGRVGDRLRDAR